MDPVTKTPSEAVTLDSRLPNGDVSAPGGTIKVEPSQRLANAAASGAATSNARLTTYANGIPADSVDDLIDFLAPRVPAPLKFEYVVRSKANNFAVVIDDSLGATGESKVVNLDPETLQLATLRPHGLATPVTEAERKMADATPGNSGQKLEQRRTRQLRGMLMRSRAYRVMAIFNTIQANATEVSMAAADPIVSIRTAVTAVALQCGDRAKVRVVLGADAWDRLMAHDKLTGGEGGGYSNPWTIKRIAELIQIPAENLKVSYHTFQKSKQGKAAARDWLFAESEVWVLAAAQNPDPDEDSSTAKRFSLDEGGDFDVQIFPARRSDLIDVAAYELASSTNSAAFSRLKFVN